MNTKILSIIEESKINDKKECMGSDSESMHYVSEMDWADVNLSVKFPEKINSLSFSYDGGRVHIYINDKEVYGSALHGNDVTVNLKRKTR